MYYSTYNYLDDEAKIRSNFRNEISKQNYQHNINMATIRAASRANQRLQQEATEQATAAAIVGGCILGAAVGAAVYFCCKK